MSGSHSTGKSTLIDAFLENNPHYLYAPEAFETLADDIELTSSEGPLAEDLRSLVEYSAREVALHAPGASVIHERSPVDYLAYAAASRATSEVILEFLAIQVPVVRASLSHLDLIVFLPVSAAGPIRARAGENPRFRRRVDESLRRALLDDDYDLFGSGEPPQVVELSPLPDRQLSELIRLTKAEHSA